MNAIFPAPGRLVSLPRQTELRVTAQHRLVERQHTVGSDVWQRTDIIRRRHRATRRVEESRGRGGGGSFDQSARRSHGGEGESGVS